MTSQTQARSVSCPACSAAAGNPCLLNRSRRNGRIFRSRCHQERHDAYRRTKRAPVATATLITDDELRDTRFYRDLERRLERQSAELDRWLTPPPKEIAPAVGQVWRKYCDGEKLHDIRIEEILDADHAGARILNHRTNCRTRILLERLNGNVYKVCGERFRYEFVG